MHLTFSNKETILIIDKRIITKLTNVVYPETRSVLSLEVSQDQRFFNKVYMGFNLML